MIDVICSNSYLYEKDGKKVKLVSTGDLRAKCNGNILILASGPSASDVELDKLSDFDFFAVNGSAQLLNGFQRASYFYAINDLNMLDKRAGIVVEAIKGAKVTFTSPEILDELMGLYPDCVQDNKICVIRRYDKEVGKHGNAFFQFLKGLFSSDIYQSLKGFYSAKYRKIGFSVDLEKGYFSARTIPYVAAQISVYMGFDTIYFAGLDLSGNNRFYEKGKDALSSTLDECFDRFIEPSFRFLKRVGEKKKVNFYNLSLDSKLSNDVLKKIKFDDLV